MTMLRNLMTVVGVLAIIVIAVLFIRGDDLVRSLWGTPHTAPAAPVPTGKAYAILSASQANLVEDRSFPDSSPQNVNLAELLEAQQTGFPPRNIPYLAIINIEKKQIKYWKLSKNVRKVSVRSSPTSLELKINQTAASSTPYQVEIWVPREGDLNLEFDLGPPSSSPRGS